MPTFDDEINKRYAEMDRAMRDAMPGAYWEVRDRYAEQRTRADLDRLLRYGHFIPVRKGLTEEHVELRYPGWSWNQLVRVLKAADVLVVRGGSPPRSDSGVKEIYFDSEQGWLVDWSDGRITVGDAPPGSTTPKPTGKHLRVYSVATCEMFEDPLEME